MQHRHLNHEMFTLAAIDDIIARGKRPYWVALPRAALADPDLMQKILRVCRADSISHRKRA
jgi:2,4-dienoyl-CoA reductase-like NADH-dependent reductase (Old Yellow Enzyme family)